MKQLPVRPVGVVAHAMSPMSRCSTLTESVTTVALSLAVWVASSYRVLYAVLVSVLRLWLRSRHSLPLMSLLRWLLALSV
jgi:hypothetical protein